MNIAVFISLILIVVFIIGMALIMMINNKKVRISWIELIITYIVIHTFLSKGIFKYKNFHIGVKIVGVLATVILRIGIIFIIIRGFYLLVYL
ncbi:hypothetical protein [Clostridium hydrogeniformans]|uniref:hypothetical protein n=1 Tax=Clostridium hydrogeniformans TaxID=349933 RepID=UPI0004856CFA|nr:hypothetical protein [Clostridium hydrogeniformans]